MGVRAALQEWLYPSEEGQTIAAGNFREFSRKAGLMHRYNTQLEKLLVYAWDRVRKTDPEHADVYIVSTVTVRGRHAGGPRLKPAPPATITFPALKSSHRRMPSPMRSFGRR